MTITWMALLLLACGGGAEGDTDGKKEATVTVVAVESVSRGSVAGRITTTSVVEAERAADIVPVAPGVVLSLHADDGDVVRRGDLLAVLESVSLSASAERARAEVTRLTRQADEMRALRQSGAVSQRELDDLLHQLQTAETNAREASRSFGQTRLTAPFDGVVARRDARLGELVSQRAFQVVDLSAMRVLVDLPERDVGRVQPGQPVRLVSAYDEELEGSGHVARVAPVIDATTGTFRVIVEVDRGERLRPGQFVNVHVEVERRDDALVVPRRALLWEDGRPIVFAVVPAPPPADGEAPEPGALVAARTVLTVGLIDDRGAEVLGGIGEGAEVVVVGQSNLKDGARVRTAPDVRVEAIAPASGDAG